MPVIDVLRRFAPQYLHSKAAIAFQVKSVLSKIILCRTPVLKGRRYQCRQCGENLSTYNSCGDRHCPQCSGARRGDWFKKTQELFQDGVPYFQIVFTLPDRLSRLILGNRKVLYPLLMQCAWQVLREAMLAQNLEPAALMVLHTWNQELGHHPHVHAIVPGAGPSANRDSEPAWVQAKNANNPKRKKPFLTNHVELAQEFRMLFMRRLGLKVKQRKLSLPEQWSQLRDDRVLKSWLLSLNSTDWNTYIQGPPRGQSSPVHILKYLTNYLTGGPISDKRIVGMSATEVTFTARNKSKKRNAPPVKRHIAGTEFTRRWSMHVLPKGFTRVRR